MPALAGLILGLCALLPLIWAAISHATPAVATGVPPMWQGAYLGLTYGTMILSFNAGILAGLAARAEGRAAAIGYGLSLIPALWGFFMVTDASGGSILLLAAGFAALAVLDLSFVRGGLAPSWWMACRLPLIGVAIACLAVLGLT